jgi:hypothetical protein
MWTWFRFHLFSESLLNIFNIHEQLLEAGSFEKEKKLRASSNIQVRKSWNEWILKIPFATFCVVNKQNVNINFVGEHLAMMCRELLKKFFFNYRFSGHYRKHFPSFIRYKNCIKTREIFIITIQKNYTLFQHIGWPHSFGANWIESANYIVELKKKTLCLS